MAKPTALGAYTFGGGFTLGVQKYFKVQAHFEEDNYGVRTAKLNFPKMPIYVGPEEWPRDEFYGVDFVYGNPPCAAWSALGKTIGGGSRWWENDPRVNCSRIHMSLVPSIEPKVWAWESVYRAWGTGRDFIEDMAEYLMTNGYHVYFVLHDAQHIWGRQRRHRIFVVASKVAIDWKCPFVDPITVEQSLFEEFPKELERVHGEDFEESRMANDHFSKIPKSFWNACPPGTPLRQVQKKWAESGRKLPKGIWKFGFGVVRLPMERVAGTMVGPDSLHPVENRKLSLEEYAFLCGYPIDWKFETKAHGASVSLMTRAVLPKTGEWLAKNVARATKKDVPIDPGMTLVDFMKAPGRIEEYEIES